MSNTITREEFVSVLRQTLFETSQSLLTDSKKTDLPVEQRNNIDKEVEDLLNKWQLIEGVINTVSEEELRAIIDETNTLIETLKSKVSDFDDKNTFIQELLTKYQNGDFNGTNGNDGQDGKNAYELAVSKGYTGTLEEWLESLNGVDGNDGQDGKNAYELAVSKGYMGTLEEWLESLNGTNGNDGQDGKNAYELAVSKGYTGTLEEWLESLNGVDGNDGQDGKNAYELAVSKGYMDTLEEWLESFNGSDGNDGKNAYELAVSKGYTGTLEEWLESLNGTSGNDGKSALESFRTVINNPEATEQDMINYFVNSGASDTGWKSLKPYLVNGWHEYSEFNGVFYRKIGSIVFMKGLVKSGNSEKILENLPQDIVPSGSLYLPLFSTSSALLKSNCYLSSDGFLVMSDYSSSWTSIVCSYLVD